VGIGAWHVKHPSTAYTSEIMRLVGRSSQLGRGRRSTDMIGDGCPDTNRKVLI
jgi:hypothetical protein